MNTSLTAVIAISAAIGLAGYDVISTRAGAQTASVPSARAQAPERRPRTRIRVSPPYPYRVYSTPYPVPYEYEYPGPGAVRECTSWLAPEYRVSGPVIVPKMRCWWER